MIKNIEYFTMEEIFNLYPIIRVMIFDNRNRELYIIISLSPACWKIIGLL